MFDEIIGNFSKSSEVQKNKATFGIWLVIYIIVFSISLIFNFSINFAMGVSCILAGLYSIFTGYAFINHTIVFSFFSMFHTRTLGRVVGLFFVFFGLVIFYSEFEILDESMKAFFVIYPVTCAPTSYHFPVESFDCFGLMRPSVASVDFWHIHAA